MIMLENAPRDFHIDRESSDFYKYIAKRLNVQERDIFILAFK